LSSFYCFQEEEEEMEPQGILDAMPHRARVALMEEVEEMEEMVVMEGKGRMAVMAEIYRYIY
jgi:hypothetical protein